MTAWPRGGCLRAAGLGRLLYTGLRTIGTSNILLRQTKVPHAFFCQSCNKVAGIFDVTNCLEDA